MTTAMDPLAAIRSAFARRGHEGYGEGVSQLDHALQCGYFAERDGASEALVAAAYLHDIGHLQQHGFGGFHGAVGVLDGDA